MDDFVIEQVTELQLDRSDWQLVKFGDVAIQQKESVDRENTDLTRYVKGEHMGSEDLHLREWGELTDEYLGPAFIRKFEQGDILYGSRRTYLRKVAVAHFDSITSNTTFVIEANENRIDKRLLPYVMLSEGFAEHSIRNSKGSVNPYINWKDIADYEFLLPPKDQQAKLAELLRTVDEMIESNFCFLNASVTFYEVEKNHLVLNGANNVTIYSDSIKYNIAKSWIVTTIRGLLKENYIASVQDGNHGDLHPKSSDYCDDGIPFIMANTLVNGEIDFKNAKRLPKIITDKLRIGFSMPNDVLLSHKGTVGEVAIVPESIEWPYLMLTPQITYYRLNPDKLANKFLYFVFTSKYFQQQLSQLSSQSTRAYIGITAQRKLKVIIPDTISEQLEIVKRLLVLEENLKNIKNLNESSQSLQKSLINQIF